MDIKIKVNEILNIQPSEYDDWTICLNNAPWEDKTETFVYSLEQNHETLMNHMSWHKSAGKKVAFRTINTKYCLQFIRLDRDYKWDQWLFMGAFEAKGIYTREDGHQLYNLVECDRFSSFKEKLIIQYKKHQGDKQAKIRINLIEILDVVQILEQPYIKVNRPFKGYDSICLPFSELKLIIESNVDNWRELLSNVNCIYVITDLSNGKLYVGSTYNWRGIWGRWSNYVYTNGHGGDVELKRLINDDPDYAIKNFQFSVLEVFLNSDDKDSHIKDREKYWANALDTAFPHGYNRNLKLKNF